MSRLLTHVMPCCLILLMALMSACSNNPVSSTNSSSDVGNMTLSIKGLPNAALSKGVLSAGSADDVTVTSARFVFEKIELENKSNSAVDFKFDQPFIQDLLAITSLAEIQTFQVPFGTYDKVKVDIDDLDSQDGDVFTQNPDLQNLSIRIEGLVNNDSSQAFVFTSDISINVRLNLKPPIVIDSTTVNSNLVLDFDYDSWFRNDDGNFLSPAIPGNQQRIERNIKASFRIFRDDNRDGQRDEDFEVKGRIDSLGTDYIIVAETSIFVTGDTRIVGDNRQQLSFSDLAVGMIVEVHADVRDNGELVATKIEIEDDDNDDDGNGAFEAKAPIDSLGADFLVVADTVVFVNNDTRILGDNHQELTFADLAVGMIVELRAVRRDDGSLLATKIEVENDDDGDGNADFKAKAQIDSLGTDFLILAETVVFVNNDTRIFGDDHQELTFADLAVGMIVELRAVRRDDGSLLATKIEVENDGDGNADFKAKAQIDSLGTDFLILADTQVFVNEDTRIKSDNHNELAFSDLQVGMHVEVYARRRDDNSLVATKIKVED